MEQRSEEHTSELQSLTNLVCRLLLDTATTQIYTLSLHDALPISKRFLDAGAYMIMIESEGITENVKTWRTDAVAKIIGALGLEKVMFEAADPEVFAWYIKNYGAEIGRAHV